MERPLKESLTVEFKSDRKVLPMDDLYKELVAMANTDGGTLYLGIEDNGYITGVNAQHMNTVEMTAKYKRTLFQHCIRRLLLNIWITSLSLQLKYNLLISW